VSMPVTSPRLRPWHLWVVVVLTLFWNGSGALTIAMAQMGLPLDMAPNEVAYYASQPLWFVLATDLAILLPIAAAVALLMRSRSAVWLFALALVTIAVNDAYELAAGTSLALADSGWRSVMIVVMTITVLQCAYAWAMTKRGVLQ
jgi:hypothetical protein